MCACVCTSGGHYLNTKHFKEIEFWLVDEHSHGKQTRQHFGSRRESCGFRDLLRVGVFPCRSGTHLLDPREAINGHVSQM